MTSVSAVMRRSYTVGMFDDLTDSAACVRAFDKATGITTLDFDADLTDEQVAAVWALMESKDDADQERRADLRTDCEALAEGDPLRRLYCYVLGDQM